MTNVIPMPGLAVEMQFSEIEALIDAMIFMNECCDEGDRARVMNTETSLLYLIKDKCQSGHKHLERMPGHYGRRAS